MTFPALSIDSRMTFRRCTFRLSSPLNNNCWITVFGGQGSGSLLDMDFEDTRFESVARGRAVFVIDAAVGAKVAFTADSRSTCQGAPLTPQLFFANPNYALTLRLGQ